MTETKEKNNFEYQEITPYISYILNQNNINFTFYEKKPDRIKPLNKNNQKYNDIGHWDRNKKEIAVYKDSFEEQEFPDFLNFVIAGIVFIKTKKQSEKFNQTGWDVLTLAFGKKQEALKNKLL